MNAFFFFFSFRNLSKKPLRAALTALGVCFGLSLWVAIRLINQATLASFQTNVESISGRAQITIRGGETGFDENIVERVHQIPGVLHAVPMVINRGYFSHTRDTSSTLMILGVDLLKESGVRTYKTTSEEVIEDPLVFLNQPDSIILTHAFAQQNNLKMEDQIQLNTAHGVQKFTVRGLLTPDGPAKAYGGSVALMDIDGARYKFGKEFKVDRIDVVVEKNRNIDEQIKLIELTLSSAASSLTIERPNGQARELENLVHSFQVMLEFFSNLSLLVGLFLVTNSISIAVAERKKEIGTLRALGATRQTVLGFFLSEALIIGFLGSVMGTALGYFLSQFLVDDIARSLSSQFITRIDTPPLEFNSIQLIQFIVTGTICAGIASLFPAYRSTQIKPLEAIQSSKTEQPMVQKSIITKFFIFSMICLLVTTFYTFGFKDVDAPNWVEPINMILTIAGVGLITPALTVLLLFLMKKLFKGDLLVLENLMNNSKRTTSNVLTLIVGLSFVILISTAAKSFTVTIQDWIKGAMSADLLISSSGSLLGYDIQPIHENVREDVLNLPSFRSRDASIIFTQRYTRTRYKNEIVAIKAMNMDVEQIQHSSLPAKDFDAREASKRIFSTAFSKTIVVSELFSKHFKIKAGDQLELITPSGPITFEVYGVIVDYASPQGVIFMNRDTYQKYWKDPLVSFFGIKLKDPSKAPLMQTEIDRYLGQKHSLMTSSSRELREMLATRIEDSFRFLKAIQLAALVVACLGILNTLLVSVLERTREIGLLRAIGMSAKQVFKMILKEALVQGFIGATIAVFLGSWVTFLWMQRSLPEMLGWVIDFHYPFQSILLALIAGLLVTLLAGFLPSRRASTIQIKNALEYE